MDKGKLHELFDTRAQAEHQRVLAEQGLEKLRVPMTILFSDIRGSTSFAEKEGDVAYMNMITRHNRMLFPVIEAEGGRVVKTIGDAILAQFSDQIAAVKAAVGMQRTLAKDREGRNAIDQIRVRIGLHYGQGLVTDDDVFGDVVNAASRVQNQAEAEQILITDTLLDAARAAGYECAQMGRAELKGKEQPLDLYAVAWSDSATQQLIQEVESRFEKKYKELQKQQDQIEEEFEAARTRWRTERRTLNAEIEQLEESVNRARQAAQQQVSEDLQSELKFELEEAIRARTRVEEELTAAQQRFESERKVLKTQLAALQASMVEAMERSNNPARVSMLVREQVEARLVDAKEEWQLQWEGERKRLLDEIKRLRSGAGASRDPRKEAARRAILDKLGKLPGNGTQTDTRQNDQAQRYLEDSKAQWDTERAQLNHKIKGLENDLECAEDVMRADIFQDMRLQYEPRLVEAIRERQQLELTAQALRNELASERQHSNARIEQLEKAIPEAQDAARKQAVAELQANLDAQLEEAHRYRLRMERKYQDMSEELEEERRLAKKQIALLEKRLKEAELAAYRAQKSFNPSSSE